MFSAGARCKSCQRQVLRTFINSFAPPSRDCSLARIQPCASQIQTRDFSHQSRLFQDPIARVQASGERNNSAKLNESQSLESTEPVENLDPKTTTSPRSAQNESLSVGRSNIPWYLQDRTVVADISPFSERQRIPDLPSNPPPILEELLKQLSVDMGLDYLALLDLRNLDPPPALGGNLLMILGTARSVKHLNVSADRFCRWLRSEHRLSPVADGLLGRNELKLKLRRKSRKAKIMNAAGVSGSHQADDGIVTEWICVDVGRVESGIDPNEVEQTRPEGYVGFGSVDTSVKIVVQIMTEAKRGEMDLEGLWQSALERAARRDTRLEQDHESNENEEPMDGSEQSPGAHPSANEDLSANSQSVGGLPMQTKTFPREQIRRFHSSVSRSSTVIHNSQRSPDPVDQYAPLHAQQHTQGSTANTSVEVLHDQLRDLLTLDVTSSLEALGKGEGDRDSTQFLEAFYSAWPLFPEQGHYDATITLHCHALHLRHSGYTKETLVKLLSNMEGASFLVTEDKFLEVLDAILFAPHSLGNNTRGFNDAYHALQRNIGRAAAIMERMEAYGYDLRQDRIFQMLHNAVTYPVFDFPGAPPRHDQPSRLETLNAKQVRQGQYYVRETMERLYIPSDAVIMDMIEDYARQGNWPGVRKLWDMLPRHMRHRGPMLYAQLFHLVAATQDQKRCQETLREYTLEMERENPPVLLEGELAVAVSECLIAARVNNDPFWLDLHAKCRKALPETTKDAVEQPAEA